MVEIDPTMTGLAAGQDQENKVGEKILLFCLCACIIPFLNTFFRNQSKTRRVIYFIGMYVRDFIKTTTPVAQSCATNAMIPGNFQEFANKTSQQKRRRMQRIGGGGDAVMQTAAAKKNSRKAKKPSPKPARRKSSRTQKQVMSNKKDIEHVCDENGCQHEDIKRW